jgi:hypothetical protein
VTRQELLDAALREMEAATWSPERWAQAIEKSTPGTTRYHYERTHNWKAQNLLWQAAHTPGAPPPAPGVDLRPVRSVLILADDPWGALNAPPHYQFWITADLGSRKWYESGDFIHSARQQGRTIRAWADCKADHYTPGVGTGPADAKAMADQFKLDGWAGEGENAVAFQRGYDAGARAFVANLGALADAQRELVGKGEVVVTSELYRNKEPGKAPDWMNLNAGVGSNCIACYASEGEGARSTPIESPAYADVLVPGVSVYCGGGPKPNWKALP